LAGGLARSGWVNVGTFSVQIRVDSAGDVEVEVYAIGNEDVPMAAISATRVDAIARGAMDADADDWVELG
jgi:hypothetical protein